MTSNKMSRLTRIARQIKLFQTVESFSDGETLRTFVWRSSGMHQVFAGMLAVVVTSLNFLPVELRGVSWTWPPPNEMYAT